MDVNPAGSPQLTSLGLSLAGAALAARPAARSYGAAGEHRSPP